MSDNELIELVQVLNDKIEQKEVPIYRRWEFILTHLATVLFFTITLVWNTAIIKTRFESDINVNKQAINRVESKASATEQDIKTELRYVEDKLSRQIERVDMKLDTIITNGKIKDM